MNPRLNSPQARISALCLATPVSPRYVERAQALAVLDTFHVSGGTCFEALAPLDARASLIATDVDLLGSWLRSRAIPHSDVAIALRLAPLPSATDGSEALGRQADEGVQAALRVLGTDQVDSVVVGWSKALLPLEQYLSALARLQRKGAVRRVILSAWPTEHLDEARASLPGAIAGVQLDYSLLHRSIVERGPARFCENHDIEFIARAPLAGGHLVAWPAQRLASFHWRSPSYGTLCTAAHAAWPAITDVARSHEANPAQIALAWVLAQPFVSGVRISVRSVPELHELIAAAAIELSPDDLAQLGDSGSPVAPHHTPNLEEVLLHE